ncbi:hypothetical protein C8T65DRAFT_584576, partial [Cerioporus squamosus]
GEMEHIHSKDVYGRTNKVNHEGQIARRTLLSEKLRVIKARVDRGRVARKKKAAEALERKKAPIDKESEGDDQTKLASEDERTKLPYSSATQRYHIAQSQRSHDNVFSWVSSFENDPALDFYHGLKEHALSRLQERGVFIPTYDESGGSYSFQDRARLVIHKEQLYWHDVLRLNWTSYDLRRSQDSVNPKNHGDIMLLADNSRSDGDDAHPYIYARVVHIFHINVRLYGSPMHEFERMDVLFVRWFRLDKSHPGGMKEKRLHRVEFVPCGSEDEAFGFVNPADVVRGSHIIPAFAHGKVNTLLGPSMARKVVGKSDSTREDDSDFRYHYVNL